MAMNYEELDNKTREFMLSEFEAEQKSNMPFRSNALSPDGHKIFPELMRQAIISGNEETLYWALTDPDYWYLQESYMRNGVLHSRRRNISQAAERLAVTEFSTWYVRGLAKRLLDE